MLAVLSLHQPSAGSQNVRKPAAVEQLPASTGQNSPPQLMTLAAGLQEDQLESLFWGPGHLTLKDRVHVVAESRAEPKWDALLLSALPSSVAGPDCSTSFMLSVLLYTIRQLVFCKQWGSTYKSSRCFNLYHFIYMSYLKKGRLSLVGFTLQQDDNKKTTQVLRSCPQQKLDEICPSGHNVFFDLGSTIFSDAINPQIIQVFSTP